MLYVISDDTGWHDLYTSANSEEEAVDNFEKFFSKSEKATCKLEGDELVVTFDDEDSRHYETHRYEFAVLPEGWVEDVYTDG